jgi:hypothetical protein
MKKLLLVEVPDDYEIQEYICAFDFKRKIEDDMVINLRYNEIHIPTEAEIETEVSRYEIEQQCNGWADTICVSLTDGYQEGINWILKQLTNENK